MKKVLFVSSAIVMASMLTASPLVYEVTIKGKTTIAKTGKLTAECFADGKAQSATYRKQGTIDIKGLIWFCECESLVGPLGFTSTSDDGCFFWDVTNRKPLTNGIVVWPALHRIDNKMKKAEGVIDLTADGWHMMLAGFGTADSVTNGVGRLVNLKGNFAGYRTAPTWRWIERGIPCSFCDSGIADVEHEDSVLAWPLCSCAGTTPYTAISGTWNIKLNKTLSARLNDVTKITEIYAFPSYVTSQWLENDEKPANDESTAK